MSNSVGSDRTVFELWPIKCGKFGDRLAYTEGKENRFFHSISAFRRRKRLRLVSLEALSLVECS